MERRPGYRYWFVGWGLILLCATALWAALPYVKSRGAPCAWCLGNGVVGGPRGRSCSDCDGTGGRFSLENFSDRYLERILGVREAVIHWVARSPVEAALLGGCLLHLAVPLWMLRVVRCRVCGESGRLLLEATSTEGEASRVDVPCDQCEGRGTLLAIDRWRTGG